MDIPEGEAGRVAETAEAIMQIVQRCRRPMTAICAIGIVLRNIKEGVNGRDVAHVKASIYKSITVAMGDDKKSLLELGH